MDVNVTVSTNGHVENENPPGAAGGLGAAGGVEPRAWKAPVAFGGLPPATEFPVAALHPALQKLALEGADAFKCPVDFFGMGMLGAMSAAIANSRRLLVNNGWFASATIYAAVIAEPGSKKTPALDRVLEHFDRVDKRLRAGKPVSVGWLPGEKICRVMTTNGSINGLRKLIMRNPRGIGWFPDELRVVMETCNQYNQGKKGTDWSFLLKAWSNTRDDNDLVNEEKAFNCDNPFLTIIGGMTPSMIPLLAGPNGPQTDAGDGFLDRFLISYPAPMPAFKETWASIRESTGRAWEKILQRLLACAPYRNAKPKIVKLSPAARVVYEQFTERDAEEVNSPEYDRSLRGIWSKHRSYFHRLTLILACCDAAADGVENFEATADHATRAGLLIEEYFRPHLKRVLAQLTHRRVNEDESALWANIKKASGRSGEMVFSLRELKNRLCGKFQNDRDRTEQWVKPILAKLAHRNLIRFCDRDPSAGNRASPRYEINPLAIVVETSSVDTNDAAGGLDGAGGVNAFDEFMNVYPNPSNRLGAQQAYWDLDPDAELHERMIAAVRVQIRSASWQAEGGRFIPNAEKWIRGRRWEDEQPRTQREIASSRRAATSEIGERELTDEERAEARRVLENSNFARRHRRRLPAKG